jgi:glutathione S-transferase
VWDIDVERVSKPGSGIAGDEQKIAGALPKAEVYMSAFSDLMGEAPRLAGPEISLADLHAVPIFAVFRLASEGARLLGTEGRLRGWWERISTRPSFVRTQVPPAMNHMRSERLELKRNTLRSASNCSPDPSNSIGC